MGPDVVIDRSTTAYKAITVSCTTFHWYYIISHLDKEVEYIWNKQWTAGKVMYLLARYSGAVYLILACIGTMGLGWDKNLIIASQEKDVIGLFVTSCLYGQIYVGTGPLVITLAEVILMMRVYALYGGPRKMLVAFITLTCVLVGFDIWQLLFSLGLFGIGIAPFRFVLAKGDVGCVFAPSMSGIAWTVTSFIELFLFLLVLWKVVKMKRADVPMHILGGGQSKTQDITGLMARDSVAYFVIIFCVCIFGAIAEFLANRHHITNRNMLSFLGYNLHAYLLVAITIMTILTSKMLINLRAEYYGPDTLVSIQDSQLTWNAYSTTISEQQSNSTLIE